MDFQSAREDNIGFLMRITACKLVLLLMHLGSSSDESLKTQEPTSFICCSLLFTAKNTLITDLVAWSQASPSYLLELCIEL